MKKYRLNREDAEMYIKCCNDLVEGLIARGISFELDGLFKVTHDFTKANKHKVIGTNKRTVKSVLEGRKVAYAHGIDYVREADKVVSNYPKYVPYEPDWWKEKMGFVGLTSKEISKKLKTWYIDHPELRKSKNKKSINENSTAKTKKL